MRTRQLAAAAALVGAGLAIGWFSGQGSGSAAAAADGALMAQDYAEIEQLYWRYNHGADFRDADLFVSAFADDAVFKVGDRQFSGREELMAFRRERHAGRTGDTGRRHWNNGWRITPTADGAMGRTYWLLVDVSGGQPNHVSSGYYDDEYVKTPDGWRISSRTISLDAG